MKMTNFRTRKKVTLFSFTHRVGLASLMSRWSKDGKTGYVKLFENVHTAIARLAMRNPDVDFVIKPKGAGGEWPQRIVAACRQNGIDIESMSNLSIIPDCNVHDLILSSDVVCAFATSSILEAAIASKPVIIPYFDEALTPEYNKWVLFKDDFHLFDIAHSVDEFESLILKRLSNPKIDKECISQRFHLFDKCISSTNSDALDKYTKAIKDVISNNNKFKNTIKRGFYNE